MTIKEKREAETITYIVEGRLETANAPELEAAVIGKLAGSKKLVMDFCQLEYIASAGIRVLLKAYKEMKSQDGILIIRGANDEVTTSLTITGFADKITMVDA